MGILQILSGASEREALERRVRRLEQLVEAIAGQMGVDVGDPLGANSSEMEEIRRLVVAGEKIQAIKLYRECTGSGLKDALDAVDRM